MQTYKPDSVSRKLETLIIYLDLQLLVSSSYLIKSILIYHNGVRKEQLWNYQPF